MKSDIDTNPIDVRIDKRLQEYLKVPPAERGVRDGVTGQTEYDRLVRDLALISMDYADTLIKTRVYERRQQKRKGW